MSDNTIELVIFITIEIIAAVWLGIRLYAKKAVEHRFKEKLEDHKHDLGLIAEKAKFNYGRMNQDFGLWTVKRHESYAKLHNATAEAISKVMSLRGFARIPNYEQFCKDEIEQLLKDRNYIQTDIDSVILHWDSDKKNAMKQFAKLDKLYREHLAEVACSEAQNALIDSQLYISTDTYGMLDELQRKVYFLLINYRAQYWDEIKGKEEDELKKYIPEAWKQVTSKMRSELSGGYKE
ncbi:hypothetical protein [Sporomusa sp.]|uniref:hypothetical protein n=1 Tax=Sporomusa sp. TaxID=2078658 RepID=UPI002C87869E|nr:hypothetical protein [Sporomusa sp.]HWR44207.1 hypothetical protein [Sporomusa sp.]